MTAPSDSTAKRFASVVWSLWTDPDPSAPISPNQLQVWWDSVPTPADRVIFVRLLDQKDEAFQLQRQARQTLEVAPDWAVHNSILQIPVGSSVTDDEKESMADYIVRCKSAIRYCRMYKARFANFQAQLVKSGLGQRTKSGVDRATHEIDEYVAKRARRQDRLTRLLETYNFVSVRDKPRMVPVFSFAYGKLYLCFGYDDDGRIVDRTVRKEELHNAGQTGWDRSWRWKRDDPRTLIPNEYFLGKKCWEAEAYNFVKYDKFLVDSAARKMTFYLDYCPHGDLLSLHDTWNFETRQQPIPEPLLWHLFLRLTESCLIMEQGSYRHEQADPGWFEIVHRDIKPANIFLDVPDPNYFPQYPTPKLGDFGFARETTWMDESNPDSDFAYAGTPPFMAPEQNSRVVRDGESITNPYKLVSHTNIWAVGLVMLEMVSGGPLDATLQKKYQYGPEEHVIPVWAEDNYSKELRDLIRQCIRYWPDERITVEELYDEIEQKMVANEKCSKYVSDACDGNQPTGSLYDWTGPAERYKLDMVSDPDIDMIADDVDQVAGGIGGVTL